jgi:HSP20 family molecular chaperone IbpA
MSMLPTIRQQPTLMDSFFDDFFRPAFGSMFDSGWKQDKDGNNVFEIEVPGFNQDNIDVEVNQGVITVKGETDTRKVFKRYQIGINQDVKAFIKDGILSLTLIAPPEQQPKKIELNPKDKK